MWINIPYKDGMGMSKERNTSNHLILFFILTWHMFSQIPLPGFRCSVIDFAFTQKASSDAKKQGVLTEAEAEAEAEGWEI